MSYCKKIRLDCAYDHVDSIKQLRTTNTLMIMFFFFLSAIQAYIFMYLHQISISSFFCYHIYKECPDSIPNIFKFCHQFVYCKCIETQISYLY